MFSKFISGAVLAALITFTSSVPAQAGIPIPCTGESIVKVMDIPNAPKAKGGHPIALGYKFSGCFGGEWVGYVGSDSSFLNLNDRALGMLMKMANRKSLPAEPSRWEHPGELMVPGIWALIIIFAVGGTMMNARNEQQAA